MALIFAFKTFQIGSESPLNGKGGHVDGYYSSFHSSTSSSFAAVFAVFTLSIIRNK